MAFGPFGLQAKIALARRAPAGAGHDFAVDGQLEHTVVGLDAVMVPLAGGLGAVFARQASLPALWVWPVGPEAGAVDAEQVAMAGVVRCVQAVEDLDLDGPRERDAGGGQRV